MSDPNPKASLMEKLISYTNGYEQLALYSVICGVILIAISPAVKKLMGDIK
jgi:POT family proton-dependent oligopeptide transporter